MTLVALFLDHGVPERIGSDSGLAFVATAVREWFSEPRVTTLFTGPGGPWRTAVRSRSTAMFDLFDELNRQGKTVIYITQSPVPAEKARHKVELVDGQLVQA